jgi:hypothetical protein
MGSRINLNQSQRADLAGHPAIGEARARAIVEARPFTQWSELSRAIGVDEALIRRLKEEGAELGAPVPGPTLNPGHDWPPFGLRRD